MQTSYPLDIAMLRDAAQGPVCYAYLAMADACRSYAVYDPQQRVTLAHGDWTPLRLQDRRRIALAVHEPLSMG